MDMFASAWGRPGTGAQLAGLGAIAAGLAGAALFIGFWRRRNPAERERRRRLAVHRIGRMGDATITDSHGDILYYSYSIRGVEYAASQDVSALRRFLPDDPALLIGHATLKYAPRNPANSIIVCEEWSGLRKRASNGAAATGDHGDE